jgi:hypothetical protein
MYIYRIFAMRYFPCSIVLLLAFSTGIFAQQNELKPISLDAEIFYGSIIEHNPDINHLIVGHPTGFTLSYNHKTYGYNEWEGLYNYPDWGFSFTYQDLANPILGESYGLYGHFNFYFFKRSLRIGLAQGLAYNTNPYDPETNFENNAFGSSLLSSTWLKAHYVKENIYKGFGVQAGMGFIHYSNANFKAPNNSTNTIYFSVGASYLFDHMNYLAPIPSGRRITRGSEYAERIKYNLVFRTGVNEADVNGLGQYPFYVLSAYADKRLNYKSKVQVGVDAFFSEFLIELIRYRSTSFPADQLTGDEDYRRVGVFIGHELLFNKLAFVTQLGYYVYWPYEFENQVYNRLGIKYYLYKDLIFAGVSVKAHWAKAEAAEFSIGVRL